MNFVFENQVYTLNDLLYSSAICEERGYIAKTQRRSYVTEVVTCFFIDVVTPERRGYKGRALRVKEPIHNGNGRYNRRRLSAVG